MTSSLNGIPSRVQSQLGVGLSPCGALLVLSDPDPDVCSKLIFENPYFDSLPQRLLYKPAVQLMMHQCSINTTLSLRIPWEDRCGSSEAILTFIVPQLKFITSIGNLQDTK
jgi:hypothetical protein